LRDWKPSKKADCGFPGISASFRSNKLKEVFQKICSDIRGAYALFLKKKIKKINK
jgi:hypothetical protein